MKRIMDKILKVSLAFILVFNTLAFVNPSLIMDTQAAEIGYEIYPTPHDMQYTDGEFVIRPEVNVVVEEGIDDVTINRLEEVFESKNKNISYSSDIVEGNTNVLIGTYNSTDFVDEYVQDNYSVDASLFDHFGAYFLASDDDKIVILGKDTEGAFYALTSLKLIFNQMDGSTILNFEMRDYADANIRGFIEGYYGIPWSNEDRMSLMEFGGDFKMTAYVFAPKDDPYHSGRWREPYPADKLEEIREMAEVGNQTKCRFVWTIHPFMNGGITESSYDADIQKIIAKFEQLYEVGVRQFGVLGDDAGNLPRNVVIRVMNDLQEWVDEKGDVYNLVFCPQGYNHSWQGNYSELNELDAGFPEDVQIFWTGEAVCQPVEQKTLDHFRRHNATNGERRAPLFWLNWPVNDINSARMLMGKGSLLHTDIDVDDIYGVVTNPMQEAEASKVALFAVADYTWNVKAFDDDQSWADSFKYIDEDASEALHILAKHMSNPQPNGHGLVLAESEELQPLLNEFKSALSNGRDITEVGARLIKELNIIAEACDEFHALSKNEALKDELLPFTNSLRDLCLSIASFIEAKAAIDADDLYSAFNHYTKASNYLNTSRTYTKPLISGSRAVVTPGSTHLIPLAESLNEQLAGPIDEFITEGTDKKLEITASSNYSTWYAGTIDNIADGNNSSFAWHDGAEGVNDYFQINLSQPTTIYGVNILNGTVDKNDDTFGYAKLYYQTEGSSEWKLVTDQQYGPYAATVNVTDIKLENVTAVRYQCTATGGSGKWTAMREFNVVTESNEQPKCYTNAEAYKDVTVTLNFDNASLTPTDNVTLAPNEYIGIKLDRIHEITNITQSLDNGNGIELKVGRNESTMNTYAEGESVDARYIQLINTTNSSITFDINELSLTTNEISEISYVPSQSSFGIYDATNTPASNLFDGDRTTQVIFYGSQNKGNKFVYDLGQVVDFDTLKVVCRDSEHDWPRHGKISISLDGNTWTDIMEIGSPTEELEGEANNEDNINDVLPLHETSYNAKEVTDINQKAKFIKFEITKTKVGSDKWVRFQEFEINGGAYMPSVNNPTYESTCSDTKGGEFANIDDGSLATSFIPSSDEGNLIYHISENNDKIDKIKIVVSNINVDAYVTIGIEDGGGYNMGGLRQTVNEFNVSQHEEINFIEIVWREDKRPAISEIILIEDPELEPGSDLSRLEELMNQDVDTSLWTNESKETYESAQSVAERVLFDANHIHQSSVDSAYNVLFDAIENAENHADVSELKALYAQYEGVLADDYTAKTYRVFANQLSKLEDAIENYTNVSEAEAEELIAEVTAAHAGLVYNPTNKEVSILTVEDENNFVASVEKPTETYTKASWDKYVAAIDALELLIANEEATPAQYAEGLELLNAARKGLTENTVKPEKPFPFTDVSEKQWYYGVINEAYQLGLLTGATDTLFKPDANMNRAMVAVVFHRMEGNKKVEYTNVFSDVKDGEYYTTSIMWAKQSGVINGYKNGTYKPLQNITREEMATMIYNFAKYKGMDVKATQDITGYTDYAKITPYARVTLQWAVENGLMSGKLNGTKLDPLGLTTRAEASKMLVNAYKVIYK